MKTRSRAWRRSFKSEVTRMKRKRSVIHVLYRKAYLPLPWVVKVIHLYDENNVDRAKEQPCVNGQSREVWRWRTKALALTEAIGIAKAWEPSSLRIHKRDGEIQEERTYPRASDPKRTKG